MAGQTNQKIIISIIIVNYKSYGMTNDCIESIKKHTKDISYEIILVDNASDSESINQLKNKYQSLKVICNKDNHGFSTANNQGISIAEGEYILFLNNDTLFLDNSLKKVLDFAENLDTVSFIGCKLLNEDYTSQVSVFEFDKFSNLLGESLFLYKIFPRNKYMNKYYRNYVEINEPTEVDVIRGAFMFCLSREIRKLNGFDERFFFYSEEADLCFRFKKKGGKVIYFPLTSIIHFGSASASQNKLFWLKNVSKGKIQFFQKHYSGLKFLIDIIIHYAGIFIRVPVYFLVGVFTFSKLNFLKSFFYLKTFFIYPENVFKSRRD